MPLPDRLTWETSDTRQWNRAHWLIIEKLGSTPQDPKDLADLNEIPEMPGQPIFRNRGHSGRVDLTRTGNAVAAVTRGVSEFTLLLSPAQFDFTRNITVTVNGRTVFDGRVDKSIDTLLKWAARDNDRTMLFAAELHLKTL